MRNHIGLRAFALTLAPLIWPLAVQAAFYPDSISGVALYLRADRDVYTDSGTTLAANNQLAQQWNDQAALLGANHATQPTSGRRPTYFSSGFGVNNLPSLDFGAAINPGNTGLILPIDLGGAKSIFVVYKIDALGAGASASLLSVKDSTSSLFSEILLNNGVGGYQNIGFRHAFAGGGSGVGFNPIVDTTSVHILANTYNGGSNTSPASYDAGYDLVDQTPVASGAIGRVTSDLGSLGIRIDSTNSTFTFGFNGHIAEVLVYDRELTLAERQQVETYLYKKYYLPEPTSLAMLSLAGLACLTRRSPFRSAH